MTLVSVIMPAYNCAAYVQAAVESVLRQTETRFELIVVDDGSTDGTKRIVESLAAKDPRIRIHSQRNSGKPSIARNAGISHAAGDFISFIDSDDLYHPRRLERGVDVLTRRREIGLVFSDLVHFDDPSALDSCGHLTRGRFLDVVRGSVARSDGDVHELGEQFYACLSTRAFGFVTPQTVMMRREVLLSETEWFPQDLVTYEDNDLWLRLALRTRFAYIDQVLAYYRRHTQNITLDRERMARGAIAAKRRNLERGASVLSRQEIRYCRERLSRHYLSLARILEDRGERQPARQACMNALRTCPSVRTTVGAAKSMLPRWVRRVRRSPAE